jgi:two-component system phosphate regulon sensor histidine kinase PhoR
LYAIYYLKSKGDGMLKTILPPLKNKFIGEAKIVTEEYKDEFALELLKLNVDREKTLSILLIALNIFLFCLNYISRSVLRSKKVYFGGFSYLHASMILIAVIFLLICHLKKKIETRDVTLFKILHQLDCLMVLMLCSLIAVENELINKQPFSYIVAVYCIASLIYLNRIERIIIYVVPYIFYIYGICIIKTSHDHLFEYIIYSALLLLLALVLLEVNYNSYFINFINNKIIFKKNQEISNMYKITEENLEKRTEELKATVEYEKLRTAFFANISHELRTPLNVIFSAEQMIEYNLEKLDMKMELEGIKGYTQIIKQNCYRLIRLIMNFIDITKIDAGYLHADFQNIDIIKVVEDITMSVVAYMSDKKIKLIFDTDIEECIVACDPDKIERIILNLLSNAIKFTPKDETIYVSIYDRVDKIVISVKDRGIGIPFDMQKLIFERFVQVDNSISRNREGSGIGLSIVKSLVEMHKGSIRLLSERGGGSEFIIELPKTRENDTDKNSEYNSIKENQSIEKVNVELSDIYD